LQGARVRVLLLDALSLGEGVPEHRNAADPGRPRRRLAVPELERVVAEVHRVGRVPRAVLDPADAQGLDPLARGLIPQVQVEVTARIARVTVQAGGHLPVVDVEDVSYGQRDDAEGHLGYEQRAEQRGQRESRPG